MTTHHTFTGLAARPAIKAAGGMQCSAETLGTAEAITTHPHKTSPVDLNMTKLEPPTGVPVQRTVRQNKTTTDQYWMVRKFAHGRWICDTGTYNDREEAEKAIACRLSPSPGVEYVPVRITETTVVEYDAA